MTHSQGTLLGGRVRYDQPVDGYRTGIEPVLLAASIPARPGQHVLEAGTGAGAALLCLAHRVPGLSGLGVERDPGLAALARRNVAANGFALTIEASCVEALPPGPRFDHALANPPWHDAASTASPDAARDAARRGRPGLLSAWSAAMAATLRPRGTLSLILPSARLAEGIAALREAGCGGICLLPFWPHAGEPARLIVVRGLLGDAGPDRVLPGLVLHAQGGGYSAAAEAVLRGEAEECSFLEKRTKKTFAMKDDFRSGRGGAEAGV